MDIQLEKLTLIKMIADTDDISVISAIKDFFTIKQKDFWEELSRKERFDIEESDKEISRGELYSFEEVMAKHRI